MSPPRHELDPEIIDLALGRGPLASASQQQQAFVRLYEHYERRVRGAIARAAMKVAYRQPIQDVRQEVWCRFSRQEGNVLRYYDPARGSFGPFVTHLAYQQALDVIRKDRRHSGETATTQTYEDDIEDLRVTQVFAQLIQADFFDTLMATAKDELSAQDQAIIYEIYFNGRSARTAAALLGINHNTIYKRHQRIKQKLHDWAVELLATAQPEPPSERHLGALTTVLALVLAAPQPGIVGSPAPDLAPDSERSLP